MGLPSSTGCLLVSILTGLERPVQRFLRAAFDPSGSVSILTGLQRPVQPYASLIYYYATWFQSSPALKDRCNRQVFGKPEMSNGCQSSPALKDRCNAPGRESRMRCIRVSILTGLARPVQRPAELPVFRLPFVSILTGLERPVQLSALGELQRHKGVSILTGLERPVQRHLGERLRGARSVSILTGLERPVQPEKAAWCALKKDWFQSSPALKDRCNPVQR